MIMQKEIKRKAKILYGVEIKFQRTPGGTDIFILKSKIRIIILHALIPQ